jgi:hypothetical protein
MKKKRKAKRPFSRDPKGSAADRASEAHADGVAAKRPLRLEYVQAKTLALNPANWRTHGESQLAAIGAVLKDDEVGWAGALLFNEKTGRLIDGHGRLKVVEPDEFVPVLIGSWSDAGEKKVLATLDPLAAMAGTDAEKLNELMADVDLSDAAFEGLTAHFDELLKDFDGASSTTRTTQGGNFEPVAAETQSRLDQAKPKEPIQCPSCGHHFVPEKPSKRDEG